ncbi:MAG: C10 family peptidase [Spirochaetales bacterium]|nr:C10 family peptidase [Spirochaetales bacterium]
MKNTIMKVSGLILVFAFLFVTSCSLDEKPLNQVLETPNQQEAQSSRLLSVADINSIDNERFSAILEKGTGTELIYCDQTRSQFISVYNSNSSKGFRLHSLESYNDNGVIKYTIVLRKVNAGEINLIEITQSSLISETSRLKNEGWRINLLSVCAKGSALYYTASYRKSTVNDYLYYSLTRANMVSVTNSMYNNGYRIHDVDTHVINNQIYYNVIYRPSTLGEIALYGITRQQLKDAIVENRVSKFEVNKMSVVSVQGKDIYTITLRYNTAPQTEIYSFPMYSFDYRLKNVLYQQNLRLKAVGTFTNPVLLKTHWSQEGLYAKDAPGGNALGCWSTAIAQIMYYHKKAPTGSVSYQSTNYGPISGNLGSPATNWNLIAPQGINSTTLDNIQDETARFSYNASLVVQKNFGTGSYVLKVLRDGLLEKELKDHYGVTNVKRYSTDAGVSKAQIETIIKTEIDASRPVFLFMRPLASAAHAMVIDEYNGSGSNFEVHINMGGDPAHSNNNLDGFYNFHNQILHWDDVDFRLILTIEP